MIAVEKSSRNESS